ncbi:hypothetical protein PC116_g31606, partial [Phytophthora cactorum]
MVALYCAVVGVAGSAFPVDIDENKSVGHLKKAIAEDQKCDFAASKLQLYLVKKGGTWLKSKDLLMMRKGEIPGEDESHYMNEELEDPTDKICTKFPSTIPDGTIHVLVVVPEGAGVGVASVEPSALPTAMHRHPERLKRWAAINEMIRQKNQEGNEKTSNQDTNRKRKNRDIDSSMPYSSLSWTDLEPIL